MNLNTSSLSNLSNMSMEYAPPPLPPGQAPAAEAPRADPNNNDEQDLLIRTQRIMEHVKEVALDMFLL